MDKVQRLTYEEQLCNILKKANGIEFQEVIWNDLAKRGIVEENTIKRWDVVTLEDFQADVNILVNILSSYKEDLETKFALLERGQEKKKNKTDNAIPLNESNCTNSGICEVPFNPLEVERAQALAEYLAKYASAQRDVLNFRRDILGSNLLSLQEADKFITSAATRFASPDFFVEYGIPYVKHTASLVKEETRGDPPVQYVEVSFEVEPGEEPLDHSQNIYSLDDMKAVEWRNAEGNSTDITYAKKSLLDNLIRSSNSVVDNIHWTQQKTILFILTGTIPLVPPIQASYRETTSWLAAPLRIDPRTGQPTEPIIYNTAEITLTIQHSTSPDSVKEAFRHVQQQIIGHPYRPMTSKRKVPLLRFVTEQMSVVGSNEVKLPKGRKLLELWNRAHPEGQYDCLSLFWRDFSEAKRAIICPSYLFPDPEKKAPRRTRTRKLENQTRT